MGLRAGQGVLRRKPIEQMEQAEGTASEQLTRALGLWQLTAIGVGGIIGAGIFTLVSTVANEKAEYKRYWSPFSSRVSRAPRPRSPTPNSPG